MLTGSLPTRPAARLDRQPALDGVRALAVLAVVVFHADGSWLPGGYLGVSVFFTLSGYLITALLLGEHAATGRIDIATFYARRARRLLPASLLCIVAVAAGAAVGAFGDVDLRRDVVGAALQVFNWVQLTGGDSYGELFDGTGGAGPLDHYWSLAIEEQFYWIWPLALAGIARLVRATAASATAILVGLTVVFVAAGPLIASRWGPDAAYWSTPARVGEILTGATAAALLAQRHPPRWARWATAPAGAAIVAAAVWFPTTGGPAYAGWLPALSVVTALFLVGLQVPGPLRRALSWSPLVFVGLISYGIYLYHWPVFLVINQDTVGFGGVPLLALQVLVTLDLAALSYVLLEQPVRRATVPGPALTLAAGTGAVALAVVLAFVVVPTAPTTYLVATDVDERAAIDPDEPVTPLLAPPTAPAADAEDGPGPPEPAGDGGAATEGSSPEGSTPDGSAPETTRPARIVVVGDSTAASVGAGLSDWAAQRPDDARIALVTRPGCPLVAGPTYAIHRREQEISQACRNHVASLPDEIARLGPDVVVVMTSWDTFDRRWDEGPMLSPLDPVYRDHLDDAFATVTDAALDAGATRVVWIQEPALSHFWNPDRSPDDQGARHQVLRDVRTGIAEHRPGRVETLDLAAWLEGAGLTDDQTARPDGVHWTPEVSIRAAHEWLGPELLRVAHEGAGAGTGGG